MTLNRMQQVGFERAKKWWIDGNEQIFKIAGYAGTGKTFLSATIATELADNNIAFCAYTGKAALVMQQRGMPATTIHQLIYNTEVKQIPYRDDDGRLKYKRKLVTELKEKLEPKPQIILVDESSMVDTKILRDLLSFDIPIIAVGDPFQLPPVNGDESDLLTDPDVTLEEIMRQDEGSAIAYLAEKIRKSKPLREDESYPGCIWQMPKEIIRDEYQKDMFKWADQIIAGRNSTVNKVNQQARQHLGFEGDLPVVGDKLICKKNAWDTVLFDGKLPTALVNGLIGYCTHTEEREKIETVPWRKEPIIGIEHLLNLRPVFEDKAEFKELKYNPASLWESKQARGNMKGIIFQFAYCITCHASQGSEWDNILLYDDSWHDNKDPMFQARWRYTGITRAAKRLVWLR
ncbi:exodeoxyribonuclease-5 [Sporomusaceae bacterium BoRhaA]|uniref:ATP-dependent DNA helicase n=1 Tax=Pelorhabdus rhamnosifermentans TaxID=2772457 RepID=UPI001C062355|nr:AAA family ATPase [Pelorhabdus rhamnosifermentans]MBU2703900.1 exodeoxyribonuclease-5 [Pelorhabdus rhamnosifermentans]